MDRPATKSVPTSQPAKWLVWIGVLAALLIGLMLRTIHYRDMEYKGDEAWTFEQTQTAGVKAPIPTLGMPTSVSVRHPGGSLWVFLALARLTGVTTPEGLGLACMMVNSLALVLVAIFAWQCVPSAEREPWLWAVALAAVNPIHVLLHRKIWPPSIMPLFVVLFLIAWWYRHRRAGAFAWGLTGALIGGIYPAAMFLAIGFAVWAWLWDRAAVRWRYWLLGSMIGAAALVPWVVYVVRESSAGHVTSRSSLEAFRGLYFLRWLAQPFGLEIRPYLGRDFPDLLRHPLLAGRPTYILALAYAALLGIAGLVLVRAIRWLRQQDRWRSRWHGDGSATSLTVGAALWGFGIIFTLTLLPIRHYYMVLTFPFVFVWFARLVLSSQIATLQTGRAVLLLLCVTHLSITMGHLGYIHEHRDRPIGGEYGVPYSAQVKHHFQPARAADLEHDHRMEPVPGHPGLQRGAEHPPSSDGGRDRPAADRPGV